MQTQLLALKVSVRQISNPQAEQDIAVPPMENTEEEKKSFEIIGPRFKGFQRSIY